jgi:hypothetical protein
MASNPSPAPAASTVLRPSNEGSAGFEREKLIAF